MSRISSQFFPRSSPSLSALGPPRDHLQSPRHQSDRPGSLRSARPPRLERKKVLVLLSMYCYCDQISKIEIFESIICNTNILRVLEKEISVCSKAKPLGKTNKNV